MGRRGAGGGTLDRLVYILLTFNSRSLVLEIPAFMLATKGRQLAYLLQSSWQSSYGLREGQPLQHRKPARLSHLRPRGGRWPPWGDTRECIQVAYPLGSAELTNPSLSFVKSRPYIFLKVRA